MPSNTLNIIDNRTGREYEVEVEDDTIRALDLRQVKVEETDFGLMTYDPGYTNTASCRSAITFIDGGKGILRYRGYPIEDLAESYSFLEIAYLIHKGELPSPEQFEEWSGTLAAQREIPRNIRRILEGFRYDSNPMHMLMAAVGALGSFYPESEQVGDAENRRLQIHRLMAKIPCIAAYAYRRRTGQVYVHPDPELPYTDNFLNMMFGGPCGKTVDPAIAHALDVLFTLHADHEQNCSTSAMRGVGSSLPDPYMSVAAAIAALAGPLHGGANAAVLKMLSAIGGKEGIPGYMERVKKGEVRLMGFGHRVYKNYDPRARIIKKMADQVFAVTGTSPLLDVALELERIALEDEYFVKRRLYPNVDFYSGLIYQAIGFPSEMFTVLFAVARTVGWLAQWDEFMDDPERRIARPRQIYTGPDRRDVPA